jgi:hypothetical protein
MVGLQFSVCHDGGRSGQDTAVQRPLPALVVNDSYAAGSPTAAIYVGFRLLNLAAELSYEDHERLAPGCYTVVKSLDKSLNLRLIWFILEV